ncbi:uncharacterized protein F5891DRAFT_1185110 [Suillus fuscotomentosus]|uniref:Uncharacterized protein n=1 Tax=Suillus fuscotomentosus TaxID=1912939 RepID=A0AAD4ECK7_9AGAM|nr:uncharacterized protein F5891DRAFT_1185110 [Suillus fuscotomentosus]KAG1903496.1 hypothetical protein F5891DRAFT_1185110 [Suillus fuscotomentosus]
MHPKYKTSEECREARLKTKKENYARRRVQEQAKSCTRWRRHRGAAMNTQDLLQRLNDLWLDLGYRGGTLQCEFLESHGLSIVMEVDQEGWDSVKPQCDARILLQQALDLRTAACDASGPLTDQLRDRIVSAMDTVGLHVRALEELLSLMDVGVDTYFDALRYGSLVWQGPK